MTKFKASLKAWGKAFCYRNFWKKKPVAMKKPEGRRLRIPTDKVRRIRELGDKYSAAKAGQDRAAHFDLWEAVAEIHPEVLVGNWAIEFNGPLQAEVVERLNSI